MTDENGEPEEDFAADETTGDTVSDVTVEGGEPEDENAADETTGGTDGDAANELTELVPVDIDETNPDRRIDVYASWEGDELHLGDTVTLRMELIGYDGLACTVFWQCDRGEGFVDCDETMGMSTLSFVVDEENAAWVWRAGVVVTIPEIEVPVEVPEEPADAQSAADEPAETPEAPAAPAAPEEQQDAADEAADA